MGKVTLGQLGAEWNIDQPPNLLTDPRVLLPLSVASHVFFFLLKLGGAAVGLFGECHGWGQRAGSALRLRHEPEPREFQATCSSMLPSMLPA